MWEGSRPETFGSGASGLRAAWLEGRGGDVGVGVRVFHDPVTGAFVAGTVGQRDDCTWLSDVLDAVQEEMQ